MVDFFTNIGIDRFFLNILIYIVVVNKNLSYDLFCLTVYKLFYWFLNLQNAMDGKDKKI